LDSTIRGGIAHADYAFFDANYPDYMSYFDAHQPLTATSTCLRVAPSRSAESSISLRDLPDLEYGAFSADSDSDDDRTILTGNDRTILNVAMGMDVSSLFNLLHNDPEFDSLRLNSEKHPVSRNA